MIVPGNLPAEISRLLRLLLFRGQCLLCGSDLVKLNEYHICGLCRESFTAYRGPCCPVCGTFNENSPGPCASCSLQPPPFIRHRSFGVYEKELRALLLLFKYSGIEPLKGEIVPLYLELIRREFRFDIDGIVIVPRDGGRKSAFRHMEILAGELEKKISVPFLGECVAKQRTTLRQAGLTAALRRKNLRHAFALRGSFRLKGKTILLLDDVCTTGSTIREVAALLKRAGAAVYAATLLQSTRFF